MSIISGNIGERGNILNIPESFVTEIVMTKSREVAGYRNVYELTFSVNIREAVKNSAYFIKVKAHLTNPSNSRQSNIKSVSKRQLAKVIKKRANEFLRSGKQKKNTEVGEVNCSLLSNVSSLECSQYEKDGVDIRNPFMQQAMVTQIVDKNATMMSAKKDSKTHVVQTVSYIGGGRSNFIPQSGNRGLALYSVLDGLDPASAVSYAFPVDPVQARMGRIIPHHMYNSHQFMPSFYSNVKDSIMRMPKDNIDVDPYLTSLLPIGSKSYYGVLIARDSMGAADTMEQTLVTRNLGLTFTTFKLPITINYPDQMSPEVIYFTFEVLDDDGVVKDTITLPHSLNIGAISQNFVLEKPELQSSVLRRGVVKLTFNQTDTRATSVSIYKKTINLMNYFNGTGVGGYKFVKKVPLAFPTNGVLTDNNKPGTTVIYRAIAEDTHGNFSQSFSSAVVVGTAKTKSYVYDTAVPAYDITTIGHCVITTQRVSQTEVQVEAHNISSPATRCYMMADDVSAALPKSEPRNFTLGLLSRETLVGKDTTSPYGFEILDSMANNKTCMHNNLIHGHTYRYTLVFSAKDGSLYRAPNVAYYTHNVFLDEGLSLSVSEPKDTTIGKTSKVQFETEAGFLKEGYQEIVRVIKENEALSSFVGDIEKNKGKFQSLLRVKIDRINLTTGTSINFGAQPLGKFLDGVTNDKKLGLNKSTDAGESFEVSKYRAPNLKPGHRYRYVITLLKASIFDMLIDAPTEVKDQLTLNKYKTLRSKFLSKKTLQSATLPMESEFFDDTEDSKNIEQTFLEGETTYQIIKDIEIPVQPVEIKNVVASTQGLTRLVTISWDLVGNTDNIDHVQVLAEYQGTKAVVGVVHLLKGIGKYKFVDTKLSGLVGQRKYTVRLCFNNYMMSNESQGVTVDINANLGYLDNVTEGNSRKPDLLATTQGYNRTF